MKKCIVFSIGLFMGVCSVFGQDISQNQVPSVIVNKFQNTFPESKDVEWEKKEENYKVEFEIGFWNDDHSAWYSKEGELMKQKEEISKKKLPEEVYAVLKKDYKWYWIKDVEKITEKDQVNYAVEVKSIMKEWDIVFDESGEILSKKAD